MQSLLAEEMQRCDKLKAKLKEAEAAAASAEAAAASAEEALIRCRWRLYALPF